MIHPNMLDPDRLPGGDLPKLVQVERPDGTTYLEMTVRASSSATFGAFTLANDAGSTFEYVPARLVARNVSRMVGNRAARRRYAALVRRGVKP